VHDLGVLLDEKLTIKQHTSNVASISIAFYHVRRLKKVRSILGPEITANLVSAFVLNRLTDYCNTVFAGLAASTAAPLQRVQNAAARLVKGLSPRDHMTSALRDLHWLPIQHRISYKLCVLMHLVHTGNSPSYLPDLITTIRKYPFQNPSLICQDSPL